MPWMFSQILGLTDTLNIRAAIEVDSAFIESGYMKLMIKPDANIDTIEC